MGYDKFLDLHRAQLEHSGVPEIFWANLWKKLHNQIFDGGLNFSIAKIDYEDCIRETTDPVHMLFVSVDDGISCEDSANIFLIDHAWTYEVNTAKSHLSVVPGLLDRMCHLMGHSGNEDKIDFVLKEMWRYNQFFTLNKGTIEERMPVWYVMDELGSAITHSDDPNFRTIPFFYVPEGTTYTLLFPIKNVDIMKPVTRDFVENQTSDPSIRRALLIPWVNENFMDETFIQIEPDESYFLNGRTNESLPVIKSENNLSRNLKEKKLKVFTEYEILKEYLTDPAFEIVDNSKDADIYWLLTLFKDYKSLSEESPEVFINQFPYENVITVKDLLSVVCRRNAKGFDLQTLKFHPSWLPATFNLSTELVKFVSYFQHREEKGLDNYWICKPWNLARGLDIHPTNNLNHILRLPCTGPKIAQKYVSNPVLYTRPDIGKVKFDVRYVILLKSVAPLEVYAYSNFFLRFANKEFALDNFDCYEQHFTVMNYSNEACLHHVKCKEFLIEWNKMYPDFDWCAVVEPKIFKMLRQVFEAAVSVEPPKGIGANPQSRAVYAVDLMLEWNSNEVQPVLLEMNFSPDNKRACEYYPDFYNQIFKCLFLNDNDPQIFHDISKFS